MFLLSKILIRILCIQKGITEPIEIRMKVWDSPPNTFEIWAKNRPRRIESIAFVCVDERGFDFVKCWKTDEETRGVHNRFSDFCRRHNIPLSKDLEEFGEGR